MDPDFWKARWESRQIGFHLEQPHSYLERFGERLLSDTRPHVLVPLCGKSPDLLWLARAGARVTGAELVASAVEEFFEQTGRDPQGTTLPHHQLLSDTTLGVGIFVGNFFELSHDEVGAVSAVYDRAALVALPPDLRPRYVEHVLSFLAPGSGLPLVTVSYEQSAMPGPPFSVDRSEVESLFQACEQVELLASQSLIEAEPRFRERGLSDLWEHAYWIVR